MIYFEGIATFSKLQSVSFFAQLRSITREIEQYGNIRYVIAVRVFHKNKAPFEAGFGPANDDYESSAITT